MEKVLIKLARQLNAFDEASIMSLWEKYAEKVQHFEPSRRWEESALVFGFIQSLRWKNQLFNYNWALSSRPRDNGPRLAAADPLGELLPEQAGTSEEKPKSGLRQKLQAAKKTKNAKQRTKVLNFKQRENVDETPETS